MHDNLDDRDFAALWSCAGLVGPIVLPVHPEPMLRLWRRLLPRRIRGA